MARDIDYHAAISEFQRADRIVLTTHVKPDGDALGSAAALRHWLRSLGKEAETIVPSPPALKYGFLDPDGALKVAGRDVHLASLPAPDLVCIVDTCTWLQLEGMEPLVAHSGAPVLAIDHHRTNDPLADSLLVDPEAAATAAIVHRLLSEAGATIDASMATYLFAGLATDTDWFRLPSAGPREYRLAASLIEAGAQPTRIHEQLHLNDDLAKAHLWGRAIETLRQALGGRVTVMRLTRAMFREVGADIGDTENLINECMRVRGTKVGIMLVEADRDQIRVSLRSKDPVNILQVAERFGGGGHVRAAGARREGALDDVEAAVLEEVEKALDDADGPEKA